MKKTLFLDRDGVINKDIGYLHRIADLEFVPGAVEALRAAAAAGYQLIVLTNQSGVARGYYTEDDVRRLHEYMGQLLKDAHAPITAFYYCPHHKEGRVAAYTCECTCRKPKPGMLLAATADYNVDLRHSFLVGDKNSDVETARAAGIDGYLFTGDNLAAFLLPVLKERGYDEDI